MGSLEGNAMAAWTIFGDTENPPLATAPHIWPRYVYGRSDLSGKQTCGPEQDVKTHERNDQSPEIAPRTEVTVRDVARRRPGPFAGKAEASWEETGKSTTRATGVGVQARREGFAEITSGRATSQQGQTATGEDLSK